MCGRYYRRSDKQRIAEAFRIGLPTSFDILPSYNVAPSRPERLRTLDSSRRPRTTACSLLRPFDADAMTTWKVGKDVGSVRNNAPELLNQA